MEQEIAVSPEGGFGKFSALSQRDMRHHPLYDWFHEFLHRSDASVVMRMPGCYDQVVNHAHKLEFDDIPTPLVYWPHECSSILDRTSLGSCTSKLEGDQNRFCYCEKGKAILALLPEYCVFENAFKQLHRGTKTWEEGLAFWRLEEDGGTRTYKVYKVLSRLLPGSYRDSFLEARLLSLGEMAVKVRTSAFDADNVLPTKLECRTTVGDGTWLEQEEYTIPREEGYLFFGRVLDKAKKLLGSRDLSTSQAKDFVLDSVQEIKDRYEPILNFTCCLFSNPNPAVVIKEIDSVLRCLLDALVVVGVIKQKIETKLHRDVFVTTGNQLSGRLQLDLFRGTLSVDDLEAIDRKTNASSLSSFEVQLRENLLSPVSNLSGDKLASEKGNRTMSPEQKPPGFWQEFNVQLEVFTEMLPQLLTSHYGKFVAFCEGQLVDADTDRKKLAKRMTARSPGKQVLIEQVIPQTDTVTLIHTPTF